MSQQQQQRKDYPDKLPRPHPSPLAMATAMNAAAAQLKYLSTDYWFTPGDPNAPRLGFVGVLKTTDKKKMVANDDEFTSWIVNMIRTSDGNAYIIETANSIYIAPAAPGALQATELLPGMPAHDD